MLKQVSRLTLILGILCGLWLPGYGQLKPTPRDTSVVSILFGADVYSSMVNYNYQPTLGVATVGINYFRNGWDVSLKALLLSTQNEVTSDQKKVFGRTLVTPGFSSSGFRGLQLDVASPYFSDLLKNRRSGFLRHFRLNGYVYSGAQQWDYTADVDPNVYDGLVFSGGINASYTLETTFSGDNTLALTLYAGFTTRFLAGQLAQSGTSGEIEDMRLAVLNTDKEAFAGLEWGAMLRFNWVYAKFNFTYFGGDTQGLSGVQDLISAGILTDIHVTKHRKFYPVKQKKKITRRGSSMKR